jgi:biotin synthase
MITLRTQDWQAFADKALAGERLTMEEGLSLLEADDDELLSILHAAFRVRKHYYGKKVKLNLIINAKSGLCPEDCGYCSQSIISKAPINKYPLLEKDVLVDGARKAMEMKAGTYCIVASGRGPTARELDQVVEAVKEIKETMPMKICACLGVLSQDQANRLKEAGVERYNHNLNTSASNFANITTTHTYDDRVDTLEKVKASGMSPCSGCIIGMGETNQEIVEIAYALRELDADSIPVTFLNPIAGTRKKQQLRKMIERETSSRGLEYAILPTHPSGNYDDVIDLITATDSQENNKTRRSEFDTVDCPKRDREQPQLLRAVSEGPHK